MVDSSKEKEIQEKLERLKQLEEELRLKNGLPHLFGFPLYEWQKEYQQNRMNRVRLLSAANQIGKSSIQIIDRITVATKPELWPELWPRAFKINKNTKPYSWYLYPSSDLAMSEFLEKWVPNFLPRGEFKNHPIYGWKHTIKDRVLKRIDFNSGWTIYFKTYSQDVHDLQASTVFAIDCDEELPEPFYSELQARLLATDGHFSMVFTATKGQKFWYNAMEMVGTEEETFTTAWKKQISMYDCLYYADGSQGPWTKERIKAAEALCKNKEEIARRIFGRFVKERQSALKYPWFNRKWNMVPYPVDRTTGRVFKGVPNGWMVYSAVDYGSGGEKNHPAAYVFLSVSPDAKKIRLFKCRRLDKIETTAGDVYNYYKQSKGSLEPARQVYDYSSRDFFNIALSNGDYFDKAEKSHSLGEMALNTALKFGILRIYEDDESLKLAEEFENLTNDEDKTHSKDDLIDAVRYCLMAITKDMGIDWSTITPADKVEEVENDDQERRSKNGEWLREREEENEDESIYDPSQEFAYWNELLD